MMPNANDPLANLRDIHLPEPISAWLPAPGWWILMGTVAAVCLLGFYLRKRQRNSARRFALQELDQIAAGSAELQDLAAAFSALLRRAAIVRFGAAEVASLNGPAWAEFLQAHSEGLQGPVGTLLADAPYAPLSPAATNGAQSPTREQLIAETRQWIRRNL